MDTKNYKLQSLEKKRDKKRFGRDSHDHIRPNWPRSNSTVQDQDQEGHHFDLSNKPGEHVDDGTVWHVEFPATGTVNNLHEHRFRSS